MSTNCLTPQLLAILLASSGWAAERPHVAPFETGAAPSVNNKIDELAAADWRRAGLEPANPASDAVFLRRAYLDTIGTLPASDDAAKFLTDTDIAKRAALIDRLLDRPEFADYWAMKWSDLLRVKSPEFPIDLWPNAVQAYYRWIHTAVRDNVPYDQFVRQLLVANGSNLRVPEVNFARALQSRDAQSLAQAVALIFMGTRTANWPKARLDARMAAFFFQITYKPTSEWKEEIIFFDPQKSRALIRCSRMVSRPASCPVGIRAARSSPTGMLTPGNPQFARSIVNRIWSWLLGRGIIQQPGRHPARIIRRRIPSCWRTWNANSWHRITI